MGQNPHDFSSGPAPINPNPPPQPVQPNPMAPPPPLRPNPNYLPPEGVPPTQARVSQNPPTQHYPGYQHNLAAAQGYPGYQRSFDALAPAVPEVQATSFPGYHEQPIAPIILPPPQPSPPARTGRVILIVVIVLLLAVGGSTGYLFYINHQNASYAQTTAIARANAPVYPFSKHLVLNDPLTS